ncbi:MAG: ABC transporter ATP-binding protein, partial [Alphaproteobacteria bacterium]
VATFIGSPPMNLAERNNVLLGFRPEHLLPRQAQGEEQALLPVAFRVTRVEYLGADRLVYGLLEPPFPEEKIIAKLPSSMAFSVEQGERVEFVVRERDVRRFDRHTGLRPDAAPGR